MAIARKWQPLETAPRDGTWVLVNLPRKSRLARWDDSTGWWVLETGAEIPRLEGLCYRADGDHKPDREEMTHRDIHILRALLHCVMPPGSADKRFVRSMEHQASPRPSTDETRVRPTVITPRQRDYLHSLRWKYRRQIPNHVPGLEEGREIARTNYQRMLVRRGELAAPAPA